MATALPKVHGDTQILVAVILDRLDCALAHAHALAKSLAHLGLARAGTALRRVAERGLRHLLQSFA